MAELTKVRRVIAKQMEGAPHETLLRRLDHRAERAASGQALLRGGRRRRDRAHEARRHGEGRIALAIANELGIPVKLIGIGEALEDLRPFDAHDFARALLEA